MIEETWRVSPPPFLSIEQSSLTKYIIIPKIYEHSTDDIFPLDKVGTNFFSDTGTET